MLPLPDSMRDRIQPPVWRTPALRRRGQRGGLLLSLPKELRGRIGTPLGMTSALLREMALPTQKKKKKRRTRAYKRRADHPRGDCRLSSHDHDGSGFAQRFGFGRQRCLTIV